MKLNDLRDLVTAERDRPATRMLAVLQARPGVLYGGTANPKRVAARRARNKVARASRRANRG